MTGRSGEGTAPEAVEVGYTLPNVNRWLVLAGHVDQRHPSRVAVCPPRNRTPRDQFVDVEAIRHTVNSLRVWFAWSREGAK